MAEPIDKDLLAKIKRGRERMEDGASLRNECLQFWRGNQYVYRNSQNSLVYQPTTTDLMGGGKPRHRMRTVRNIIVDVVAHEVSAATQRTPSYECNPATTDPEDITAARLAERVALYGYDQWRVLKATQDVVTYAVVADEGFAWPYWDSSVGPFVDGEIGQGEIRVRTFGPNEVYWEPGVAFHESRWCAVEQARDLEDVYELEGYNGGKLSPDAQAGDRTTKENSPPQAKLVLVTDYLERPTAKNPEGRWITMANGKRIQPDRSYPCMDHEGNILDEPVLHKLSYFSDPDSDRDMGLVRHLLDPQRTVNDSLNKILEWKNLALNPQVFVINGILDQPITDEPGVQYNVQAISGDAGIKWRDVPAIPNELAEIKDDAVRDIARIAAQNDVPTQVEAGKAIAALLDRDQSRRLNFLANLADFHSRLMRHCLYLVQRHYTEERLLKVRGEESDFEVIRDFLGAQLRGQADVRVYPSSLEPQTRQAIEAQVLAYADRQWISPEEAMQAINNGNARALVRRTELNIARARLIIQKIKDGPEFLFNTAERQALPGEIEDVPQTDPMGNPLYETDPMGNPILDPMTGQPMPLMGPPIDPETGEPVSTVPGWMPRPFDNVGVQMSVFEDFMMTAVYDELEPGMQEATNAYYEALLNLKAKHAAEQQAEDAMMAQELGQANATRPPTSGQPSMPSLESSNGNPATPAETPS